jgi:1-aminocyclopropane-1-carboxylate deaminase
MAKMQFTNLNKKINFQLPIYDSLNLEEVGKIVVKRFDRLHPTVNGNKWFKLMFNLEEMNRRGARQLVTFGGAYSNHIHATAAVAKELGIHAVGIIRGEEPKDYSPTLLFAKECGMELCFISRADYEERNSEEMKAWVHEKWESAFLVPEGGSNYLGMNGAMQMVSEEDFEFDHWLVAAGTGTTAAGLLVQSKPHQKVWIYSALKGEHYMRNEIRNKLIYFFHDEVAADEVLERAVVFSEDEFGGYGKFNERLIEFVQEMNRVHQLPLDVVYTGKLMHSFFVQNKKPNEGSVLMFHTGGLQGNPKTIFD